MSDASASAAEWMCNSCGFVYDESKGWPEYDVAPGTRWPDVHDDFTCPDCGARKLDFVPIAP
jgi:rubredoxin